MNMRKLFLEYCLPVCMKQDSLVPEQLDGFYSYYSIYELICQVPSEYEHSSSKNKVPSNWPQKQNCYFLKNGYKIFIKLQKFMEPISLNRTAQMILSEK
jgi:hypothetical protein